MSAEISLEELLRVAIEARLAELNVALPGIVQAYYPDKQTADIQPAVKKPYVTGETKALPLLTDVPVIFPRTALSYLLMPLKKDDTVLLIFAQRSIDVWFTKGGLVEPMDTRKHALADAVAIPGLFPSPSAIAGQSADDVHLVNTKGKLLLGKGLAPTEPAVLGNVAVEFMGKALDLIKAVLNELVKGTENLTTSPGNPTAPNPASTAIWSQILLDIEAHRTTYLATATSNILSQLLFTERGGP